MLRRGLWPLTICFLLIGSLSAQEATYSAGIGVVDMDPPIGIPLAGYGDKRRRLDRLDWSNRYPHAFLFKPSTGFRDKLRIKTMVIRDTNGKKLVFVSADLIGIERRLVKDIARKLKKYGYKKDELFISATHTHSGPGTLSRNIGLAAVAVDFYKRKNYIHVRDKFLQSILMAMNNLEPVHLMTSEFAAKDIQHNKWRKTRPNYYDPSAKFILARSKETGLWLGGMLNFAAHGNAMPIADTRYSADFPGAIERATEEKIMYLNGSPDFPVTLLFMNGAEGDVRHKGNRGEEIMEAVAQKFADQAEAQALQPGQMIPVEPGMESISKRTFVGIPSYPLEVCLKREGLLRMWRKILPSRIPIPLPIFPWTTKLTVARLGQITFASWPGEVSTSLGLELKNKAMKKGHNDLWFIGLANDYMTYFTNKSEYLEAEYDSCSSFYGYRGGKRIIKKLTKMMSMDEMERGK